MSARKSEVEVDYDHEEERSRHPERMSRRTSVARRPKATRARGGSVSAGPSKPGGIRQRRNKRWAW